MNGYHVNLTSFVSETGVGVTMFSSSSGMLKFATNGLYQVTCVIVGDQALNKVAIGKTSTYTTWTALQASGLPATAGYEYVYNMAVGSSPSTVITVPLLVSDISQYYYFDVFLSTIAGAPTVLYPTRSTSAVGSNYGTYIQVMPFGSYVSSATSPSAGLLMTSSGTTLSAPRSSNTYRIAMTSANNWTVNGTSTAISITSGGNFQVNQAGIYEVSLCVNADATAVQFGLGSLGTDTSPSGIGPYLYQYAPMYTQDPSTVISLPVNITSVSSYYYIDVTFPLTTSTMSVSSTSTYVMIRPIGTYLPPTNQVWSIQGSTAYYNGGNVGIGVNPSLTTETLTISGNTSFVGNVTVTSDVSGSGYVTSKRVPTGSLDVTQYVKGRVPLTTTTTLINNYLSNAAAIVSNAPTYNPALSCPGTTSSGLNWSAGGHSLALSNLALSNLFIEAWVYPTVITGANRVIIERIYPGQDFYLFINASGQLTFQINAGGLQSATSAISSIGINGWTHVAASYQRTATNAGTMRVFINGSTTGTTNGTVSAQPTFTPGSNIWIGIDSISSAFTGYIYDIRVMTGSVVPISAFGAPGTPSPFATAPTYALGMSTGYTSNLTMALQSQYFPGASTSPYGPCLTLPGTSNCYYSYVNTAFDTNWKTNGFCLEAWVNYASFANSNGFNTSWSYPYTIGHYQQIGSTFDWSIGSLTTGQLAFYWVETTPNYRTLISTGTITTGSWNHIMFQCNGANVYCTINGTLQNLTGQNYAPAGGNGTTAPSAPSATLQITPGVPFGIGQYNNIQGPNFAIAKARLVFGTTGTNGNVYSLGNFTPSPNFIPTLPSGATVAWQLESQYPLPSYPSIQDVTELPQQAASYGSLPTPVGGVTSNTLGPLTSYPAFDSIRFDGTGYIDYGNAASSVLTANLWANTWTIEGWVYPTTATANIVSRSNTTTGYDWSLGINSTSNVFFDSKATAGEVRGATSIRGSGSFGSATDVIYSIATDLYGNVYVVGNYAGTSGPFVLKNLDGTTSSYSLPSTPTNVRSGSFLVKYNPTGRVVGSSSLSTNNSSQPRKVITDSSGNMYWGGFQDNGSGGPVTVYNLDGSSAGVMVQNAYIIKYNSSGNYVARSYMYVSITYPAQVISLALDSSGNLYATGYFSGSMNIRNLDATASTSAYSLPAVSSNAVLLVKYNSSGSVVAYSYINGTGSDVGNDIAVDSSGNIYVTGYYESTGTVPILNIDTTASTSAYSLPISGGGSDAFIIKYNSAGSVVAYSYLNGTAGDAGNSLTVDSSGNLYAAGAYNSAGTVTLRNIDATASTSSYSIPATTSNTAPFIIKYNSVGSVAAYSYLDPLGASAINSLVCDSSGNLYVSGYYLSNGTVTIRNIDTTASTSSYTLPNTSLATWSFTIKYNFSGSVVAYTYTTSAVGYASSVDTGGNFYTCGYYGASQTLRNLDTTASNSNYTLPSPSTNDAFLIKYNTAGTPAIPSAPVNTWTHVAASYDGSTLWVGSAGRMAPTTPASTLPFITDYSTQIGGTFSRGQITGNLADVRVSNVARYTGSSYTVPTEPFTTDSSTLLLLKSLAGQPGTTLEIQGRGLNSTSIGAGRVVQSYPPAPMSSYLLDTTGNTAVTYGQGKYVASASSESGGSPAWVCFDKNFSAAWSTPEWSGSPPYGPTTYLFGQYVTTTDTLGTVYTGDWIQLQMPVSVILSSYSLQGSYYSTIQSPAKWWVLGSRDGTNWSLVDSRSGISGTISLVNYSVGATQAYNYYRLVINQLAGGGIYGQVTELILNGTEESLCVTSDSKVGVGIANPQRALEVAGDLVVSGTISGGAGMGFFRNRIINGDMRIAQRGTSFTVINVNQYTVDRFRGYLGSTGGVQTMTQQTLAASDTPYQYGFRYSQRVTMASGTQGAVTTVDQNCISQGIEGYHVADLNWGTPFGSPVTVSLWFRSNLATGSVISIALRNRPTPNAYVTTFTTSGQGVWQYVTATVPPPPNGVSFAQTTSEALSLDIAQISGSVGVTVNAWNAINQPMAPGATYWTAQAGNYVEATGVQLEKGTVATPFEFRPYATELQLCQRYYEQSYSIGTAPGTINTFAGQGNFYGSSDAGSNLLFTQRYMVPKRAGVAPTFYNSTSGLATWTYTRNGASGTAAVTTDRYNEFGFNSYVNIGAAWVVGTAVGQWVANAEL
jgi:hypothetical protein